MTPKQWIRVLLWTGIGLMVLGQIVALTLQPQLRVENGDLENVMWWVVDSAQRYFAPVGAAMFAGSFVVRALVPRSQRDLANRDVDPEKML